MIILEDPVSEQALPASPNKEVAEIADADTPTPVVPPPPYVPLSEVSAHPLAPSYPANIHQPVPARPQRRSALKRFFKAFTLALLILFLVRVFFWSLGDVSLHRKHRGPRHPKENTWFSVPPHRKVMDLSDPRCKELPGSDGSGPRRVLPAGYPPDKSSEDRPPLC